MNRKNVIYTRFSSDLQREESCEDQERQVRDGLRRKGIDPTLFEVIYDRAESGTKNNRPKFEILVAMIARGEVGILAVDDQSRFSRADNAFSFITDLVYSGGRFLSIGEGIDTAEPDWQLRVKVMELHNSTTIRELGRRVRRGQMGRVLDDGSAGDYCFGYESYYVDATDAQLQRRGPRPKKVLRICECESRWVRQVFHWFVVEERSISWIAGELTRLEVPKGHRATTSRWHHHIVRKMLGNAKYVGQWAWGTRRNIRSSEGKVKQVPVPAEEHIVRSRPELRIIDQELWERAQQRLLELNAQYGTRPGQKRRGPKPHHTQLYPKSLLGGLIYCSSCGARMWVQATGQKHYLGCPNHRNGSCPMAGRVPIAKAEHELTQFVAELLTAWPNWIETVVRSMRDVLENAARALPPALEADQTRLRHLEKEISNLVDQLAHGGFDSRAVRQRLVDSEQQAAALRVRISEAEDLLKTSFAMPDDQWVRNQLQDVSALLREKSAASARLLRRLLQRVEAEQVLARGKKRGYMRLRFSLNPWEALVAVLDNHVPQALLQLARVGSGPSAPEFQVDLGGPTRFDTLAPTIAEMRAQGRPWREIARVTGVGMGNAFTVWKRWITHHDGKLDASA